MEKVGFGGLRKLSGKEMQILAGGSCAYMQYGSESKGIWAVNGQSQL